MNVNLIIVGAFLSVTLAVGIYHGKGIKTFQDYAVGNRKMSTTVVALSLIATIYGGGILSSRLDVYYRQGFYALILDLTSPINIYLASRFFIVSWIFPYNFLSLHCLIVFNSCKKKHPLQKETYSQQMC